jgi:pseudouridine synthase
VEINGENPVALMRLHKFLSVAGHCSRRRGEVLIAAGLVRVNGKTETRPGTTVDPEKDVVEAEGIRLSAQEDLIYLALNKPKGYVTSCQHKNEKIVLNLINLPQRLYPVGRLDKDSTGLLILTNDGRLHHRISHPSFDHEKEYDVTVETPIPDNALAVMGKGILLAGEKTRPARITRISPTRFRIILQEGKNRQIRRMVEQTGNRVVSLNRIRISGLKLGTLKPGAWRHLNEAEKAALLQGLD